PQDLRSGEADTTDDIRHLAYGYKLRQRDVQSIPFSKLDSGTARVDTGSMTWVAARAKYFLVALIQPRDSSTAPFRGLAMRGAPRIAKLPTRAFATTVQPIDNGRFGFDLYVGPQAWDVLHAIGDEIENVNPYAGWLHGVVQPFSTIIMRSL